MPEKKKSKQQRWADRQHAKGGCNKCGKPLVTKWHCQEHAEAARKVARNRYRKSVGIAIDAPPFNQGRNKTKEVS